VKRKRVLTQEMPLSLEGMRSVQTDALGGRLSATDPTCTMALSLLQAEQYRRQKAVDDAKLQLFMAAA